MPDDLIDLADVLDDLACADVGRGYVEDVLLSVIRTAGLSGIAARELRHRFRAELQEYRDACNDH